MSLVFQSKSANALLKMEGREYGGPRADLSRRQVGTPRYTSQVACSWITDSKRCVRKRNSFRLLPFALLWPPGDTLSQAGSVFSKSDC